MGIWGPLDESVPNKFRSRLFDLGVRVVRCETLEDVWRTTQDPALFDLHPTTDVVFSQFSKIIYLADNPHIEWFEKTTEYNLSIEVTKAYAILCKIGDDERFKLALVEDSSAYTPPAASTLPTPEPVFLFATCGVDFFIASAAGTFKHSWRLPALMRFVKEVLAEYV